MKKGGIGFNIIIIFLLVIVAVLAYFLYHGGLPGVLKPRQAQKPPELQKLIETGQQKSQEITGTTQATETTFYTIMSNNEMKIDYIPLADAYGVTIFDPDYEQTAKESVKLYFEALGIKDFNSLKIDYRIKPKI